MHTHPPEYTSSCHGCTLVHQAPGLVRQALIVWEVRRSLPRISCSGDRRWPGSDRGHDRAAEAKRAKRACLRLRRRPEQDSCTHTPGCQRCREPANLPWGCQTSRQTQIASNSAHLHALACNSGAKWNGWDGRSIRSVGTISSTASWLRRPSVPKPLLADITGELGRLLAILIN